MATIGTIAWKELRTYFTSWIAYVLCAGWLFMGGQLFVSILNQMSGTPNVTLAPLFGTMIVIFLFVAPLITMRLIAEERNSATLEMLFTSPITEWQVVLGKWLGAFAFCVVLTALTGHFIEFTLHYGSVDIGPIIGYYVATLCLASTFCAFGVFCSSLTESQVVAGFLTFGGLLGSWMLSFMTDSSPDSAVATFVKELSVLTHFQNMLNGTISSKDLVFFASVTFFFWFATVRVLESRKWR